MNPTLSRTIAALAAGLSLTSLAACGGTNDTARTPGAAPSPSTSSAPTDPSSPASPSAPSSPSGDRSYQDGTYTAKGWYGGGPSSIDVELTLTDDLITAVQVTPNATNPTSLDYQNRFISGVAQAVVGRDVDEVELDRIAGSSTTPDGFNDALGKIRAEAAR